MGQIRVSDERKAELDEIKLVPQEPYGSVIGRLIDFWDDHTKCADLKKPMCEDTKALIKHGLEHKFGVLVTKIEDDKGDTIFHLEGDPEGTPVLIPKR